MKKISKKIFAVAVCCGAMLFPSCDGGEKRLSTADPEATAETRALYKSLFATAERGTMFGHQDDTAYGHLWWGEEGRSDIAEVCGDRPAVYGWDLGHLECGDDCNIDGVPFDFIRSEIVAAYARGGVNTVSWHLHNPVTGGSAWDSGRTDVVSAVLDPESEARARYIGWLDAVAGFFRSLEYEGRAVPVLFRPLHEHTGGGFWWASLQCTPDEYKALWRMTVSYLRDCKGVHNLLYVYSSDIVADAEEYFERYPGDGWVDVLGLDAYHRPEEWNFAEGCDRMLTMLAESARLHGKPCAFTETGLEGIPQADWWTAELLPAIAGRGLSWVLVWRNACAERENKPTHYFATWRGEDSAEDFIRFADNEEWPIFTESRLPDLYVAE